MIRTLILAIAVLAAPLVAQSPITSVTPSGMGYLASHADGSFTLATIDSSGLLILSSADNSPDAPDEVPRLTATWTDLRGVEHTVSTPVPSSTPAGMKRAIENHQALLDAMQTLYPPRPPN